MDREPCPWRIVDDAGGAYAFGIKNTPNIFSIMNSNIICSINN